jgi:hypothetical protein
MKAERKFYDVEPISIWKYVPWVNEILFTISNRTSNGNINNNNNNNNNVK